MLFTPYYFLLQSESQDMAGGKGATGNKSTVVAESNSGLFFLYQNL